MSFRMWHCRLCHVCAARLHCYRSRSSPRLRCFSRRLGPISRHSWTYTEFGAPRSWNLGKWTVLAKGILNQRPDKQQNRQLSIDPSQTILSRPERHTLFLILSSRYLHQLPPSWVSCAPTSRRKQLDGSSRSAAQSYVPPKAYCVYPTREFRDPNVTSRSVSTATTLEYLEVSRRRGPFTRLLV